MDRNDDFDLLGQAVARVLRDSFAAAADTRAEAIARTTHDERALDERLQRVFAEVEELRRRASRRQAEVVPAFEAALAEAKAEVGEVMAAAVTEAQAIRAQAVADARTIVDGARAEVERARALVAEERVRLDAELKDLVRDVHRATNALERSARGDHDQLLARATSEAQMILRQARLHHRSTAQEVDRMIEAAAHEAAALRSSALSDAARVAARVRGVVEFDEPVREQPARRPDSGDGGRRLRPVAS